MFGMNRKCVKRNRSKNQSESNYFVEQKRKKEEKKKEIHDQNLSMKSVHCSLCNHSQRDTIYFAVINYLKFCIRCQMKTFAVNECDN